MNEMPDEMANQDKFIWNPFAIICCFDEDHEKMEFNVRFALEYKYSARMELFNGDTLHKSLTLDIQSDITFIENVADEKNTNGEGSEDHVVEENHESQQLLLKVMYERLDVVQIITFKHIGTANGVIDASVDELRKLIFILSQFTFIIDLNKIQQHDTEDDAIKPNILATGIETTGRILRTGLRVTGEVTASAIVAAGRKYTQYTTTTQGNKEFTDSEEEAAKGHKATAEWIHSKASEVAGAILYPARWSGNQGAELNNSNGSTLDAEGLGPVKKAVIETVSGIGNAVTSITKGVTEAFGAVGGAIGETVLHNSKAKYGDEYTSHVTEHYIKAGEEIGKVGYKAASLTTNGVMGVALTAVIEGIDMTINLYDYLVGPVIMYGYMRMVQLPFRNPINYFVVLRPWSLSFYNDESDFTAKPFKIIATAIMDTLPRIRNGNELGFVYDTLPEYDDLMESTKGTDGSIRISTSHGRYDMGQQAPNVSSGLNAMALTVSSSASVGGGVELADSDKIGIDENGDGGGGGANNDKHEDCAIQASQSCESTDDDRYKTNRFIELCTVDCSTYLLWPTEDTVEEWYMELYSAARRVETIAKRKSGAYEIAECKRAGIRKKSTVIHVKLGNVIVKAAAEEDRGYQQPGATNKTTMDLINYGFPRGSGVPRSISCDTFLVTRRSRMDAAAWIDQLKREKTSTIIESTKSVSNLGAIIESPVVEGSGGDPALDSATPPSPISTPAVTTTHASATRTSHTPSRRKNRLQLLTSAAPAVIPTIKKSVHEASVWLQDLSRVLMLHNVSIVITPITPAGSLLKTERKQFPPGQLRTAKDVLSSDLVADWLFTGEFLEFGNTLSIDEKTCRGLNLQLHTEVPLGGDFILGEAELTLHAIPDVGELEAEIWLSLAVKPHTFLGSIFVQLIVSRKRYDEVSIVETE